MAQNGRASGSLADNAAVPSPCALHDTNKTIYGLDNLDHGAIPNNQLILQENISCLVPTSKLLLFPEQ